MTIIGNLLVRDAADHVVIERGATYNGKPCVHGHGRLRYVGSNKCVTCMREGAKKSNLARRQIALGVTTTIAVTADGTPEERTLLEGWSADIKAHPVGEALNFQGVHVGDSDVIGGTDSSMVETWEDHQARTAAARKASLASARAALDAARKRAGLPVSAPAFEGVAAQFDDPAAASGRKIGRRFKGSSLPKTAKRAGKAANIH